MLKPIRIIPRLDIKGPNLVKGIHLEGLRILGKPEQFAKFYYQNGADEIIYQDVVASLYDRNSLHDIVSKTAKEIFIPLTVGGGIRTIDDIKDVLRAGADKVSINTAAIRNPEFISNASQIFGSSTITVAIEAIKQNDGKYLAFMDNGREYSGLEIVSWAKTVEELGAGEIIITSVDREGIGEGFDCELIKSVVEAVNIPVIAHGGCGNLNHIVEAIKCSQIDGIAIASILHYDFIKNNRMLEGYEAEGNIDFLKSGKNFSKVESCSIEHIKTYLHKNGINCRF
ncbi:MAG: hypothetical protein ACD_79C01302G0013 [uncultured bacterium]|nr:MAG: hypothetical protein ACD_79C01302G0013 [uncultured bacterium]